MENNQNELGWGWGVEWNESGRADNLPSPANKTRGGGEGKHSTISAKKIPIITRTNNPQLTTKLIQNTQQHNLK